MRRHGPGGRAVAVAVAWLALVPVGCSRDDDPTLQGEVTTSEATTTSSTVRRTTTTVPECPPVHPAIERDGRAEHEADVDVDGRDDLVQSFPTSDDSTTVTLLVELAAGGGATLELESEHDAPAALLGTAVVERLDGRHLLWVRVGAGASTVILGLYWFDDCTLAPVRLPDGDPVELPIGGTVGSVSGAECGSLGDPEADLLLYEGRHLGDDEYEVTVTELRYEAGVLSPSPETKPASSTTDDVSRASGFRCGDVEL